MVPDDNWKSTRILSQDLDKLLNLPENVSEDFLKILENLIIHKFLEEVLDSDSKLNDYEIQLPYLGSLVVSFDDKDRMQLNFVARSSFYRKIKKAYLNKESPLIKQCSDILSEELVKRFEEGDIDG